MKKKTIIVISQDAFRAQEVEIFANAFPDCLVVMGKIDQPIFVTSFN